MTQEQTSNIPSKQAILDLAKQVLSIEASAILALTPKLDQSFICAVNLILNCKGRVVVTGMGKSGHIGNKIAATLASTGTPAFFVHPGEASHGDLGMITPGDVVIAISNSGESHEVLGILPMLTRFKIQLISMTGNASSTLAIQADAHLDIGVEQEACPLGLAPTSSTTATLAMGDALAIAALESRGFTKEDFAISHPGGTLGKRLLLKVKDLMHSDGEMPTVQEEASILDTLDEMTQKSLGMTCIINKSGELTGIYTDGDIRRTLAQTDNLANTPIRKVMTGNCKTISADELAAKALEIMEEHKITSLVVISSADKPLGILHLHDLLKAGIA